MSEIASLFVSVGAKIDEFKRGMGEVEKGMLHAGERAKAFGGQMSKYVTTSIVGIGTAAFAAANDMDKALKTIRAGTGATGADLQALNKDFKAVFRTVPMGADQVATAIADLNTRTGLMGDSLQRVAKQSLELAKLTGGDVSAQIAATTRVFGDWAVEAEQMSGTLDLLWKVSQATGISVDQLSHKLVQFGAPLRQIGFDLETSAALLGKWEKEGVNAELVLGSLRIALVKFSKAGEDPVIGLQRMIKAIRDAGDAAAANLMAVEVFGARAGPDMAAAIREGRFELDDLLKMLADSSETIEQAAKDTRTFGDSMVILKNNAQVALEPLGRVLLDLFEEAQPGLADFTDTMVRLSESFAKLPEPVKRTAVAWAGFFAIVGPAVIVLASVANSLSRLIGFLRNLRTKLGLGRVAFGTWGLAIWGAIEAVQALVKWIDKAIDTNEDLAKSYHAGSFRRGGFGVITPRPPNASTTIGMGTLREAEGGNISGMGGLRYIESLPGLANGGHVLGAGLALVGERGPEILSLPGGATVTPLPGGTQTIEHTGTIRVVGVDNKGQVLAVAQVLAQDFADQARRLPNRVSLVPLGG